MLALLQTLALLLLVLIPSAIGALAFAALFGAANGAITLARPALLAEYYGPAQYGSVSGVLALFLAGAQALAGIGAGALYAGFGSYEPVIWILATISLVSVAAVSQARVQGWPKYAVEWADRWNMSIVDGTNDKRRTTNASTAPFVIRHSSFVFMSYKAAMKSSILRPARADRRHTPRRLLSHATRSRPMCWKNWSRSPKPS